MPVPGCGKYPSLVAAHRHVTSGTRALSRAKFDAPQIVGQRSSVRVGGPKVKRIKSFGKNKEKQPVLRVRKTGCLHVGVC